MKQHRPYLAFLLLTMLSLSACDHDSDTTREVAYVDRIPGLASPVQGDVDLTLIDLQDYFLDPAAVDSVTLGGMEVEFNGAEVHIHDWTSPWAMHGLECWSAGQAYVIPVMRSQKERITFTYDPQGEVFNSVKLKGEMTSWNQDALEFEFKDGMYQTEMVLEPRSYQYIMVLDGEERLDASNALTVDNGFGGRNNILDNSGPEQEALELKAVLTDGKLSLLSSEPQVQALVLWEDLALAARVEQGKIHFKIPVNAKELKRSHVRAWVYDETRVSNDVLIPLHQGGVIQDARMLDRHDKHAMSLYNVFVDRFYNGDPSNDRPVDSPEVLPIADDMGGDIRGAIKKLEEGYFEELGINTIWISPLVKNVDGAYGEWSDPKTKFSAYHGYWPVSFTLVDDRKGTSDELKELVNKAHDHGMNVLLDFVANHVHEKHPYYQADTTVATDLYLPDGSLNTERWDDHRLTTWFDVFLPTLRLDDPAVYEMLTDSAVFWIEEFDLDGFRHDATKHVPEIFWKTLTRKLKERVGSTGKPLYQIGETYGSADLIGSYVNTGQLDAQFDFNVYDAIVSTLVSDDIGYERLSSELHKSLAAYSHHHLMGNITGNQDRGRFISYAGGALSLEEDAKKAGWSREIGIGHPDAYNKSAQLMAIIATIPGLPVIYYGDEIGSYGGNDPDNRKLMQFEELDLSQSYLKQVTASLMKFRRGSMPLLYGDFREHLLSEEQYVYSRSYLEDRVYVILNSSDEVKELVFDADNDFRPTQAMNGMIFSVDEDSSIRVEMQANSFEILY